MAERYKREVTRIASIGTLARKKNHLEGSLAGGEWKVALKVHTEQRGRTVPFV